MHGAVTAPDALVQSLERPAESHGTGWSNARSWGGEKVRWGNSSQHDCENGVSCLGFPAFIWNLSVLLIFSKIKLHTLSFIFLKELKGK